MESKNNTTVTAPEVSALKAHLALNVKSVEQSINFYAPELPYAMRTRN